MSDDDDAFIPFSEVIGPHDPGPTVRGKWHRAVAKAKAKKAEAEAKARHEAMQIDPATVGVPGWPRWDLDKRKRR